MYPEYIYCPLNKQASEAQAEKLGQRWSSSCIRWPSCLDLVLDRR